MLSKSTEEALNEAQRSWNKAGDLNEAVSALKWVDSSCPREKYSILLLQVLFVALVFLIEKSTEETNVTSIRCKERERRALLEFKQSLGVVNESDTPGLHIASWDDEEECCKWDGVSCNASTGHVVILQLMSLNGHITGTISPSLLELRYLSHLDLSFNDFNGTFIPDFIGSITQLISLSLENGNFSGPIPNQLGNLSRLETLRLNSNRLNGSIPPSFGNLAALTFLRLSYNQLDGGIPNSLWNICGLQTLALDYNNLVGEAFGFLQTTSNLSCTTYSLEDLSLTGNKLTGPVPDEIAKLSSLRILNVGSNRLNGSISRSIGQLSNLTDLDFSGNSFGDGVVISEAHFRNLSNLNKLDLSDTSLSLKFNSDWVPPFQLQLIRLRSCKLGPTFPQWIRSQGGMLSELDISASGISDSIPSWFWNTSNLVSTNLNLSFNQLTGSLPQYVNFTLDNFCFGPCFLDLRSNNLTGPLPQLPIYFGSLMSLNLSKNKLFGSITSICTFIGLIDFLDLSNNLFSGVIPNCTKWGLQVLNLAENNLSGPVPMSIWSSKLLQTLSLRSNSLSGPLPPSTLNCSNLGFLDLSGNNLSGNIPEWIGQSCSSLIFLSLESNQFQGNIPHQLCELSNLQILDLSVNKLSGPIPQCLENFTSMSQNVSLKRTIEHSNIWARESPTPDFLYVNEALLTWKGQKQRYDRILGLLLVIDLSSNQLTGEISDELASLQELVSLNLSKNVLTGRIPRKIGQLRQLQMLDLSRNKLSGNIPPSLSELTFLGTLDLSYNYLSGEIPKGTQMQSFDPSFFSHNEGLCGPPVSPNCSGPGKVGPPLGQPDQDDSDEFMKWFYAGMGLGFAVSFWGCSALVFIKRSWRHSYYRFLDNLKDWICLAFALQKARLERRIRG